MRIALYHHAKTQIGFSGIWTMFYFSKIRDFIVELTRIKKILKKMFYFFNILMSTNFKLLSIAKMGETWMILGKKKTANFRQFIGQIYIYNWSKNLG